MLIEAEYNDFQLVSDDSISHLLRNTDPNILGGGGGAERKHIKQYLLQRVNNMQKTLYTGSAGYMLNETFD